MCSDCFNTAQRAVYVPLPVKIKPIKSCKVCGVTESHYWHGRLCGDCNNHHPVASKLTCRTCGADREGRVYCLACRRLKRQNSPTIRAKAVVNARMWRSDNRERSNALGRAAHARDPDKRNATRRAWEDAHPEAAYASREKYRKAHPELYRAAFKRYCVANPAKIKERSHRRRSGEGTFTEAVWLAVVARCGNVCIDCGADGTVVEMTPAHLVPISRGGSNYAWNLACQCMPCNYRQNINIHPLAPRPWQPRCDTSRLRHKLASNIPIDVIDADETKKAAKS